MNKLDYTVLFCLILCAALCVAGAYFIIKDSGTPRQSESQAIEYYDVLNSFTFASSSVDVNVEGLTI